ncbi:DNA topoisomerase 2-like protein [Thermothielavioides terrestris NRRL 8126]|uniref:DNA topoisomerase 2 n=1 Tax=Thermothielavioides terrestris (strain ATCC 38088 / NRRL 8126) TaxID=578455 RepID=G2RDE2_THETT|nr:DNA topoisomerase 2-like protein [Thermothielavioides terrestris NRRL 8126]AEO70781.1 DNA topoisomerase 2-like protein [Thermothielavioides terrestris NRRL 8126]
MDSDVDSVFDDFQEDESDAYTPEAKPKAKAAPNKTATAKPAKMIQTTLTGGKAAPKKRPKQESDAEDDGLGASTPPKKQKKAPVKKSSNKPLAPIENESVVIDDNDDDAPIAKPAPKSTKSATETYQKLTQLEHIIKRPDTYIGSVERMDQKMWVFNKAEKLMENRTISYVPGLYKIFDEILVNAADNSQRDSSMTYLKVNVDRATGEISVENNGKGIPIEIHEKEKCYIPELIFGHLLTGSNYDDNEKKTVGGRNGYGAKLTNIFSQRFTIELQDSHNEKRYKQTWTDNMSKMEKAKITTSKSSDFVKVSFLPDYKRFGMENGIDDDLEALIYRRVYDMAGTVSGVKVWLNGEHLKINFKTYCELYAKSIANERGDAAVDGEKPVAKVEFDQVRDNGRLWQIGFTVSDGSFQQVSFVNNIATTSGGTHVNYIADQICEALGKELNKKKKGHSLKPSHFRNHIFIFINCLIDNPSFNSQTKEQLTTKISAFGSKCVLSDQFLKKVKASEAIANIMEFADRKADKMMAKSDGNKRSRISNDKLIDANWAGTKRGHECTLILTEGDSARGLAVAGRAVLDPDRIGVFPLRGKMLNVRDASIDQIMKNKEIENIKKFLGLKHKQEYKDTKGLRYGHLMIMADQDLDGSHIKGLLINFLEVQFPSLLRIDDFFQEFITPVVKVWQGNNPKKPQNLKTFFNIPQYEAWKEEHKSQLRKWNYKYLKGLGSSSNEDAQIYFKDLDRHLKKFEVLKPEESQLFELAFSKKKADARKEWLGNFIPGTYLDSTASRKTYTDFVQKELILFSMADNMRSIPSMIDGLKPGQRKVIYGAFKRNLVKDQKVAELAGYISEVAAYHHGEQSLQQTIIGLAQNYVGSNNVNCLEPSGNFGSRLAGGSDAASARYIHTRLSPFARRVFSKLDEPNLEYQFDDGNMIEPKVYVPVIPMVLVNGADGIGTGWSTSIPNYHPLEIVENLKRRMGRLDPADPEEKPFKPMTPWFRGWKGVVEPDGPNRFKFNGIIKQDEQNPNEIHVTELPIRMWTDDFKSRLEDIIRAEKTPSFIKDYREFNDHQNVHFVIEMEDKHLKAALDEGLLEKFKLTKTITTTNLVAFNTRGQIQKYESPEEIMEEYYHYRLKMYTERKTHWLGVYHADYRKLQNQYRFVSEIIENKLVVNKKKKAVLVQELRDRKYEAFPPRDDKKVKSTDEELGKDDAEEEEDEASGGARDYDYLLSMPIWSLTNERLEKLKNQIAAKKAEYDELNALSEKDLWVRDLDDFVEEWHTQLKLEEEITTGIRRMGRRTSQKIGAGRGRRPRDDDDYEPEKKTKPKAPKAEKVETKTHQRFTEKFQAAAKPKSQTDLSDDDFALLGKKAAVKEESEPPASLPDAAGARSKRAAAAKPKYVLSDDSDDDDFMDLGKPEVKDEPESEPEKVVEKPARRAAAKSKPSYVDEEFGSDSDDDDDKMLGDVGAMVKGIGVPATSSSNGGRLSLFAMSRPEAGDTSVPRMKTKPSKSNILDSDDHDDTNYEALAMSSPRKSTKTGDLDDFLSDDDLPAVTKPAAKPAPQTAAAKAKAPLSVVPVAAKKRGRPPGSKNKPKGGDDAPAPKAKAAAASSKPKPAHLSPAAKAYAAKKAKTRKFLSDDEDDIVDEPASPAAPAPAPKARPGRAAAAKAKPIYIDDYEDDEDDSFVNGGGRRRGKKDDDSDAFDMDEDSE